MIDPLQALLVAGELDTTLFTPTSRYYSVKMATMDTPDGRTIVHLCRRFVPAPERFSLLQLHTVSQGDRLDNLANQYLNDPEQFWQLCDANGAMRPDELTEKPGRKLRITLPVGIPGLNNV
jgi:hypothetical protein